MQNDGFHSNVENFDNKIVSFKLVVSNQTVIEMVGLFVCEKDGHIWIRNPQALMTFRDKGEDQIGMTNYLVTGDSSATRFLSSQIQAVVLASKGAADEFTKITSKLITVKTPSIIT